MLAAAWERMLTTGPAEEARLSRELAARARRGDPSAFDEIVRRHQPRVFALTYRMLRQREEAEDVTQEAFLKAFASLRHLRGDESLGPWICRIAARLCLSRLRRAGRRLEVAVDPDDLPVSPDVPPDLAQEVRRAVGQLPPKYRLAVVAFYLEGHSYEEAARLLGLNVRTLKTHLYRARRLLRDLLRPADKEGAR
jgi:RNA polymerase sigma-70 factor (ECF subfamily)